MGGIAFRAPVLASLFLIVALATLAMPGSANFVGEFLILLGVFKAKVVFAFVASIGVVLAAVYVLRAFIRAMHNRVGAGRRLARGQLRRPRRARAGVARDPRARALPAVRRSSAPSRRAKASVADACRSVDRGRLDRRHAMSAPAQLAAAAGREGAAHRLRRPLALHRAHRRRAARAADRPAARRAGSATRCRSRRSPRSARARARVLARSAARLRSSRARSRSTTSRSCCCSSSASPASRPCCSPGATAPRRQASHGEFFSLHAVLDPRDGDPRRVAEPRHAVPRLRAAVDPALRAVRDRAAARAARSSRGSSTSSSARSARRRCSTGSR